MRLLVTHHCPRCDTWRTILDAVGFSYEVVDAMTTQGHEKAASLGITEFPVLDVYGKLVRSEEDFQECIVSRSGPVRALFEAKAAGCSDSAVSLAFGATRACREDLTELEFRSRWLGKHEVRSVGELDAASEELKEKGLWPWK